MSFLVTLSWRDLQLFPGVDGDGSGGGARVMLGWGEQPMSALPSPPGKSCCSQAAASISLPWQSWLQHSCQCPCPCAGWHGCLTLRPDSHSMKSLPGTALGELGNGLHLETWSHHWPGTSPEARAAGGEVTVGCWHPVPLRVV